MRKKRNLNLDEQMGDMTSMIDIVFLLLIFFILMPFKSPESRIESHLPKDSGLSQAKSEEEPVDKIDIKISREGDNVDLVTFEGVKVKINGKVIPTFSGLKNRLSDMRANLKIDPAKVPVELNADEDVPFYFVLKALDYAKLNEFSFIKYPAPPVLNWGKKKDRRKEK